MKKVIDGKRYDTATATGVESWDNGLSRNDFRHCSEELYRTKNGNYFLHGEGGAMTRWSESNGNTSWGSSGIEALSPADALSWLESHNMDVPDNCPEISALITEA